MERVPETPAQSTSGVVLLFSLDDTLVQRMMAIKIRSITQHLPDVRSWQRQVEMLDRIVFTGRRAVDGPFAKTMWQDIWTQPQFTIHVAYDMKQEIVGYLVTERTKPLTRYIVTLGVHPDHRGRGIARRLMQQMQRAQVNTISLHVAATNTGAQAFYSNLGYSPTKRVRDYYARGDHAIYLQRHDL